MAGFACASPAVDTAFDNDSSNGPWLFADVIGKKKKKMYEASAHRARNS